MSDPTPPTPSLPSVYRAQASFQGVSGQPEDRFVNTFYFHDSTGNAGSSGNGGPIDEIAQDIVGRISDFYLGTQTDLPNLRVIDYYSAVAIAAAGNLDVRVYRTEQPEPREPYIAQVPYTGLGSQSASAYPNEVALCASYYGGRNIPSQRGRIYLGPLNNAAGISAAAPRGDTAPNANFTEVIVEACIRLATPSTRNWHIVSPTNGTSRPITNGWVDNAFDTIRKRGTRASARSVWEVSSSPI